MKLNDILKYKAVLLDIDDTVYDYLSAHMIAIQAVWSNLPIISNVMTSGDFYSGYRKHRTNVTAFHNGSGASRSRLLAFQALFEEASLLFAYALATDAEEIYWATFLDNMSPNVFLIRLLREFSAAGRPICAVTDMQTRFQTKKLKALGMADIVTHMVSSEETGVEKPAAMPFQRALDKLNLTSSEVIMIGDSREKDIEGARRLGIRAWQIHI